MMAIPLLAAIAFAAPIPDFVSYGASDPRAHPLLGGPTAGIWITKEGKVNYSSATAPWTGSGGKVVQKSWDIPKAEAEKLFRELMAAGLADGAPAGTTGPHRIEMSYGRWQTGVSFAEMPERLLKPLRPYLEHAEPALWKAADKQPRPQLPDGRTLDTFRYSFTAKLDGPEAMLTLDREGKVKYVYKTHPTSPGGQKVPVCEEWTIPKADAAAALDGLIADGLFDLTNTGGGRFPHHYYEATVGRWKTASFPKEMNEKLTVRLRPLLEKAHPELWKAKP